MSLYVYDAWRLDTAPGTPSQAFSPPQGWGGDDADYLDWLRDQFKGNHRLAKAWKCCTFTAVK